MALLELDLKGCRTQTLAILAKSPVMRRMERYGLAATCEYQLKASRVSAQLFGEMMHHTP
jgi:hypothetical protein